MTPQDWNKVIDMVARCADKSRARIKYLDVLDVDAFLQALEAEREETKDKDECDCVECELERHKEML